MCNFRLILPVSKTLSSRSWWSLVNPFCKFLRSNVRFFLYYYTFILNHWSSIIIINCFLIFSFLLLFIIPFFIMLDEEWSYFIFLINWFLIFFQGKMRSGVTRKKLRLWAAGWRAVDPRCRVLRHQLLKRSPVCHPHQDSTASYLWHPRILLPMISDYDWAYSPKMRGNDSPVSPRISRSVSLFLLYQKFNFYITSHVWEHLCYYIHPKFTEFLLIFLFWHRVRFFLFSHYKLSMSDIKKNVKSKANVSATYGGPLQCHKL